MKLSTRSRYGLRMMIDLARRYRQGPVRIGDIAKCEKISVKYLEQLIIPLKKNGYIKSIRGPKGGHMLASPPGGITAGEIVRLLEGGDSLTRCVENPSICDKSDACVTRRLWKRATQAMYRELNAVTLASLAKEERLKE